MADIDPSRAELLNIGGHSRRNFLIGAGGLLLAGGMAGCGGGSSSSAPAGSSAASGGPKRGGTLRVGLTGGSASDIIDGQTILAKPDQARLVTGFETLLTYDDDYKLSNDGLAEEVTAEKPDLWTIRIREGIEFHNGKTMTAADVAYSLRRVIDPDLGLQGGPGLASIDPKGISILDDRTVRLQLKQADSTIADQLAQYSNGIVPEGYTADNALRYVGTGPYKVTSFTPGQSSSHARNKNYWRPGQPYLDQVELIDFPDPASQVNALLAGQVDAITDIPFAQIDVAKASGLSILESEGAAWVPICMAIDMEPFTDVRVRQAFRLMADREQIVQQVISGHGRVGNDLYAPFDACYSTDLAQREQDIEQAKSLLKAAGKEGLVVDLHTTDGAAGMVDLAKVFAQQAKDAGVTVNVKIDPNYYGDQYLKLPFSVDSWNTRGFLPQVAIGSLPTSPYNETHWPPKDSEFISLYQQALAETDAAKRCGLIGDMQRIEYEQGGYIIPFFNNFVDAYSPKLNGLKETRAALNLDTYAHGFRTVWLS
ncbi:MAG: peptide/nickel transport system substrate-binding protein [Chloroflexota bacterium]|nr:peptide/nickel transport system substrate-binding protein [Chloroflexota bacterium]